MSVDQKVTPNAGEAREKLVAPLPPDKILIDRIGNKDEENPTYSNPI
jgi:hypothetical protein